MTAEAYTRSRQAIATVVFMISATACDDGYLRGHVETTSDGKTYLAIEDDNGGKCGPILVDSMIWPYKISEAGLINPGPHKIECGSWLTFEIPQGVIFHFDYWGP